MGLLSGLLGNASEFSPEKATKEYGELLAPGEQIEYAFKIIRDAMLFTTHRLVMVNKQGMTGKKVAYHSVPYKSISHFSIETSGHFDLDAELKIWISSNDVPIEKRFSKDANIYDVQKVLVSYLTR